MASFAAEGSEEQRSRLEVSLLLNACLDIFESRMARQPVDSNLGLLHAIDERLALYGWLTNTGVKLVIGVDMEGRDAVPTEGKYPLLMGLRDADLKPAFRALQTAYIRLLRNPFYDPDDADPRRSRGRQSTQITSALYIDEVDRIGRLWYPGIGEM
ncbi:hypothetical protein LTR66_013457 [Elasticomyces elasticus]|nr:hypothetical protein LTR66_013457 [Elasticomyces elasticus]